MSIKIITDGVLSAFADLVHANRTRLYRLWLIAPWIGTADSGFDPVDRIAEAVKGTNCRLMIVTRPPSAAWHSKGIARLREHPNHEVFECAALHTKLYIAECDGFKAAIFGSPNLTPAADETNKELALEIRSTTSNREELMSVVVSDLISYAKTMLTQDDVRPFK